MQVHPLLKLAQMYMRNLPIDIAEQYYIHHLLLSIPNSNNKVFFLCLLYIRYSQITLWEGVSHNIQYVPELFSFAVVYIVYQQHPFYFYSHIHFYPTIQTCKNKDGRTCVQYLPEQQFD